MKTGYVVCSPVSSAWSGLISRVPFAIVVGICASFAPAGGVNGSEGAGVSPGLAPAVADLDAGAGCAPAVVVESHISGDGLVKTVCPAGSTAVMEPVAAWVLTLSPTVSTLNFRAASSGFLAAAAVLTTSSWEKPSTSAFT